MVTGTLAAKFCDVSSASPCSAPAASVRRNHPEPDASRDGAVRKAFPHNVQPGAAVPMKVCCSLNCALTGLRGATSDSASRHATMRGRRGAAHVHDRDEASCSDFFTAPGDEKNDGSCINTRK